MKKGKSITLLTIICVVLTAFIFFMFVPFTSGIKDYNSILGSVDCDFDMVGGTAYTLTLSDDNDLDVGDSEINSVLDTLGARLQALGYSSYSLTALKRVGEDLDLSDVQYDIRIATKTTASISTDISTVAAYGTIKFFGGTTENPTTEIMNENKAVVDSAYVGTNINSDGKTVYLTSIQFSDYGYKALKDFIDDNSSNSATTYLKIALGDETVFSGSISSDTISNKTIYLSTSSETAALQSALKIKTGGLAYKYDISDPMEITPVLGKNTTTISVIAVAVMACAIVVTLFVLYRAFGLSSLLSVLLFLLCEVSMFVAVPGITVSIGGVVGVILSLLLLTDGIVTTFARIKEEYAKGKTFKAAVKVGYKSTFMSVLNASVVTLIIALLIFAFASGAFKSFAIALAIGSVISFLINVVLSKLFTNIFASLVGDSEKCFNLKREEM